MVALTGFATLIPAFTVTLQNAGDLNVGPTFSDATLLLAQVGNGSSIVSVPGYSTAVNATNHNGEDAIRINKDQDLGTWDFRAGFVTPEDDYIYLTFTGFITGGEPNLPYLQTNFANGTTTGFGYSFMSAYLQAGSDAYSALSTKVFVGSAQIVSDVPGERISRVQVCLSEVSY